MQARRVLAGAVAGVLTSGFWFVPVLMTATTAHADNTVHCAAGAVGGTGGEGGTTDGAPAVGGDGGAGGHGELNNCNQDADAGADALMNCSAGGVGGSGGDAGETTSGTNENALEVGLPGSDNGGVAFGNQTADATAEGGSSGSVSGGPGGAGGGGTAPDCNQTVTSE